MKIHSKLRTLSKDPSLKYMTIASVFVVALTLLISALDFVATTVMVILILALLIKLLWEISDCVENRTN
jgi:hypothetical protein